MSLEDSIFTKASRISRIAPTFLQNLFQETILSGCFRCISEAHKRAYSSSLSIFLWDIYRYLSLQSKFRPTFRKFCIRAWLVYVLVFRLGISRSKTKTQFLDCFWEKRHICTLFTLRTLWLHTLFCTIIFCTLKHSFEIVFEEGLLSTFISLFISTFILLNIY